MAGGKKRKAKKNGNQEKAVFNKARRLATVKEACAYAKMGRSKLYLKMGSGEIKAYKREAQTFVDLDSIDALNNALLEPWVPERKRRSRPTPP
jgi:hypothetical protein